MKLNDRLAMLIWASVIAVSFPLNAFASDVVIDSRNTAADNIVITEAEEGMFSEGSRIILMLDQIEFEEDITYEVIQGDIEIEAEITDRSGLKKLAQLSDEETKKYKKDGSYIVITVTDESTEASVIEISGLKLYLDRTLPNGDYALSSVYTGNGIWSNSSEDQEEYDQNGVFKYEPTAVDGHYVSVITNGRTEDDSTVRKEIMVTVGESKITSGEDTILLDTPAYINEEGYAMLPLRAVAEALDTTLSWDEGTRTVSVLRGQRIVSMEVGSDEMYINGTKVPMNTKTVMKDGRIFVPVRDLADALSIADVQWDENTNTIVLN